MLFYAHTKQLYLFVFQDCLFAFPESLSEPPTCYAPPPIHRPLVSCKGGTLRTFERARLVFKRESSDFFFRRRPSAKRPFASSRPGEEVVTRTRVRTMLVSSCVDEKTWIEHLGSRLDRPPDILQQCRCSSSLCWRSRRRRQPSMMPRTRSRRFGKTKRVGVEKRGK